MELTHFDSKRFYGLGQKKLLVVLPDLAYFFESISMEKKRRLGKENVLDAQEKRMPFNTLNSLLNTEVSVLGQFVKMVLKLEEGVRLSLKTFISQVREEVDLLTHFRLVSELS